MKKVLGVLLGLIALVVIGVIGVFALSNTSIGPVSDAAKGAKAAAANVALDAVDAKGQVKNALDERTNDIAAATGLTTGEVSQAIANLDIDSWKATALPAGAVKTGTIDGSSLGIDGSITTYQDPTYITAEIYGQDITLAVPADVQKSLSRLTSTP